MNDLELRLVDPDKNRYRLYGMTETRTLFGEPCLLIAWGRIGAPKLRRRTETFADACSLERRRRALLARRRRHGYAITQTTNVH
jgi:predicted DNA-binding WGR domain protein